jgi:predicted aspartyl protease
MFLLLMSMAMTACAAAAGGSKPLPFDLRHNEIVVPVHVSGTPGFRFLLDTGASRSIISVTTARRVGAVAHARTLMITPSGQSVHAVTNVTLQLGERTPVSVTAAIVRDDELAATARVDGILGQDVLAPLVYTIDYRARAVRWDDARMTSAMEHRIPLQFVDGRALVAVAVQGVREPLRLIPDTGADGLVLFARRSSRLPALTPLNIGMLRTLVGRQLVRHVLLDGLSLGPVTLREQPAVVLEESDSAFPPGDGLLPLHLFSQVTVNGPAGYIVVTKG